MILKFLLFFMALAFLFFLFLFQRLRLDQTSSVDPLTLLENVTSKGVSQSICVNDLGKSSLCMHYLPSFFPTKIVKRTFTFSALPELPAFQVLPSLKRLKQRVIASGRGEYDAVFMSGRYATQLKIFIKGQEHCI